MELTSTRECNNTQVKLKDPNPLPKRQIKQRGRSNSLTDANVQASVEVDRKSRKSNAKPIKADIVAQETVRADSSLFSQASIDLFSQFSPSLNNIPNAPSVDLFGSYTSDCKISNISGMFTARLQRLQKYVTSPHSPNNRQRSLHSLSPFI